jgi:hypothetical protein
MSNAEKDPEKRLLTLSSYMAVELASDLREYEKKQEQHAQELKKKLQTVARTLKTAGGFPSAGVLEKPETHEGSVITKVLDREEVILPNGEYFKDIWFTEGGRVLIKSEAINDTQEEVVRDVFVEASSLEYILLFPSVLDGIGRRIRTLLPTNT